MNIDIEIFRRGLNLRLVAAKCCSDPIKFNSSFSQIKDSLARDYHARVCSFPRAPRANSTEIAVTKIAFQRDTLEKQRNLIGNCHRLIITKYLFHLLIGGNYEGDKQDLLLSIESSMDYSLFVQYLICSGEIELNEEMSNLLSSFFSDANYTLFKTREMSFSKLMQKRNFNLAEVRKQLFSLKSNYWHIYGVDIFNFAISSAIPTELYDCPPEFVKLTGWANFLESLTKLWNSSYIFLGKNKIEDYQHSDISVETSEYSKKVYSNRSAKGILKKWSNFGDYSIELAMVISKEVEAAIESKNLHKAFRWLTTLVLVDPSYYDVLNWRKLSKLLPANCGVCSFSRAFIELKMLDAENSEYFADLDRGLGTANAIILELIGNSRKDGLSIKQFLLKIRRSLPRPAANELVKYLLSLKSLERFSYRLPLKLKPTIPVDENSRVMALRIELATEACSTNIISKEHMLEINRIERDAFFSRKLRHTVSKGMIRLSWEILRNNISTFSDDVGWYEEIFSDTHDGEELFEIWTDDLVQVILFSGANAIEYLLGANLRHGRIITSYMSAFTKSVSQLDGLDLIAFDWTDDLLKEKLGSNYGIVDEAKNYTENILKDYISNWLTIEHNGELHSTLVQNIAKFCSQNLTLANDNREEFVDEVFEVVQKTIIGFIEKSKMIFETEVIPNIHKSIFEIKNDLIENGSVLGDLIMNQIKELNSEVPNWINIMVDEEHSADQYTAENLVNLESQYLLLRPKESVDIHIRTKVNGKEQSHIDFAGSSFRLLHEVVHNLFSNAVKYSGLDYKTRIIFTFEVDGKSLLVQSQNSLSEKARHDALERLADAKILAKSNQLNAPRVDVNSGFAKIRTVASDYSKNEVEFDIDFSINSPYYTVTFKLENLDKKITVEI